MQHTDQQRPTSEICLTITAVTLTVAGAFALACRTRYALRGGRA
jgi:hypothetical protein